MEDRRGARAVRAGDRLLDLPSVELLVGFDMDVLGAERSWIVPDHIAADGMLKVAIQTFVVESDGKVIIVDTCFGNDRNLPYEHMEPLQTAVPRRSRGRGLRPRSRRRRAVHAPALRPRRVEHAAGRRRVGADVPERALPVRARRVGPLAGNEDPYNIDRPTTSEPVVRRQGCRPRRHGPPHHDEISLEPTPGHTPGHVAVHIESAGQRGGHHRRHDPPSGADRAPGPRRRARLGPGTRRAPPAAPSCRTSPTPTCSCWARTSPRPPAASCAARPTDRCVSSPPEMAFRDRRPRRLPVRRRAGSPTGPTSPSPSRSSSSPTTSTTRTRSSTRLDALRRRRRHARADAVPAHACSSGCRTCGCSSPPAVATPSIDIDGGRRARHHRLRHRVARSPAASSSPGR